MAEKKITKREVLNHIIATYENDEMVVSYAKHELDLLDNKASKKTETKVQKENIELKEIIVATLIDLAKPSRITDIQNANEKLATLSNQKMSALLKQLVDTNVVVKSIDKKVTLFAIAE